jgi:hypothetical protein
MAQIRITEGFIDDMLQVQNESKQNEIWYALSLLETFPEMGSRILSPTIKQRFGSNVRKIEVNPFDVIYRYIPEDNLLCIEGLIHQRAVR